MSKPKTCIRITGTRTGKLRARVENHTDVSTDQANPFIMPNRFEVTLGGEKWGQLDLQLRGEILTRARNYVNTLDTNLDSLQDAQEDETHDHSETCVGCRIELFARVLKTPAGYYIGTQCDNPDGEIPGMGCGPHSRWSDYYPNEEDAQSALDAGCWIPRF
jgi:hypothetical protein